SAFVVSNGAPLSATPTAGSQEVRELLGAARGVAPSLCTLAADGVYSWGGRWQAPAEAVQSDIRSRVRTLQHRRLTGDETRARRGRSGVWSSGARRRRWRPC